MSALARPLNSARDNTLPSHTAPITVRSVVCFAIQVVLNMSMLSVTAFVCFLWCVPSTILLGLAASVEATASHRLLKRARTRLQPATSTNEMQPELDHSQAVNCALTKYGLGAPAA